MYWSFSFSIIPSKEIPGLMSFRMDWLDLLAQSCPILCHPMDCSLPGSSVHGILQAIILEWVDTSSSGDLSNPRIEPVSPALAGRFFTV